MSLLPNNFSVLVSIPSDDDGCLDRGCLNELCETEFKMQTGDSQYQFRQRQVIKKTDVMRFTDLVEKLTIAIQSACAGAREDKNINEHRG